MLNIIDMINDSNILTEDSVLVSFNIVNLVSFDIVSEILENRERFSTCGMYFRGP